MSQIAQCLPTVSGPSSVSVHSCSWSSHMGHLPSREANGWWQDRQYGGSGANGKPGGSSSIYFPPRSFVNAAFIHLSHCARENVRTLLSGPNQCIQQFVHTRLTMRIGFDQWPLGDGENLS